MDPLTQEWLDASDDDLAVARVLLAHGGPLAAACFHCQQGAERLLKAFLQEQGDEPPRTHNLPQLLVLCEAHDPALTSLRPASQFLGAYYIATRYPPSLATVTADEAEQALAQVEQVRQVILAALGTPEASVLLAGDEPGLPDP